MFKGRAGVSGEGHLRFSFVGMEENWVPHGGGGGCSSPFPGPLFQVAECAQTTPMIAPLPGDPNKNFQPRRVRRIFSSRESPTQPNPTQPNPTPPPPRAFWAPVTGTPDGPTEEVGGCPEVEQHM